MRLFVDDLDPIEVTGQFADPFARRIGVGAPSRLFESSADVGESLKSVATSGAPHAVSQAFYDLEVTPF